MRLALRQDRGIGQRRRHADRGLSCESTGQAARPWRLRSVVYVVVAAVCLWFGMADIAIAFEPLRDEPILFSADSLSYDPTNAITIATGNVEVTQGERTVLADKITYYETENRVVAEGNVTLLEPSGEVVFADFLEVTGDLETGFIENVRAILSDGTRIAAAGGQRSDGNLTELAKAVYSPCFVCEDDPDDPPLWQIKSATVIHNQEERIVEFENAFLEIGGVPVFYTPYLSRPDPTVNRKTGLLIPRVGSSSDLGFVVQTPFFWAITPQSDATITSWYTFQEGPVLQLDYRHRFQDAELEFESSITRDSRQRVRGHFFGEGRYDINDTWRTGLDLNGAKGRTYLRRYDFDNNDTLTSRAFAEAFNRRNYFVANSYFFQGLDEDDKQNEIPIVLPLLDYFAVSEPDQFGGRADLHLDMAVLERIANDATDTRRLSARAGYELPFVGPIGNTFNLFADLYADGYHADNVITDGDGNTFSGFTGRVFPQAGVRWSLPLVRDDGDFQQVIEPVVEAILAPNFGNSDKIPNEDSQDVELDESNLISSNRLPGLDRVEPGTRFNYGMRWSFYNGANTQARAFAGQSYNFIEDDDLSRASGFNDNFSDYVTAVSLNYKDYVAISYRNRIDRDDFEPRRHELSSFLGVDAFDMQVSYIFFDDDTAEDDNTTEVFGDLDEDETGGREEVQYQVGTQVSRFWRNETFGIQDLSKEGGLREVGTRIIYEDECFVFEFEYARTNIEDDDIEETDEFFFRIGLKTIGDFGTGF